MPTSENKSRRALRRKAQRAHTFPDSGSPSAQRRRRRFVRLAEYKHDRTSHADLVTKFFNSPADAPAHIAEAIHIARAQAAYISELRQAVKSMLGNFGAYTDSSGKFHDANPVKCLPHLHETKRLLGPVDRPYVINYFAPVRKYVSITFAYRAHHEVLGGYIHHYTTLNSLASA